MIIRLAQPLVQSSSLFGQRLVSVFGQETSVQGSSSFSVVCQEPVSKEDVINDPSPSLVEPLDFCFTILSVIWNSRPFPGSRGTLMR